MIKHISFTIILLLFLPSLAAQPQCEIEHFTVHDGLSQGIVTGVLQDRKGFMWFSSWNGINKFDGYTFKTYKGSKEHSLSNNRITYIAESTYGDIWCRTYDGRAYLLNYASEEFYDVLQPVEADLNKRATVQTIYPLPKGIAWIACEEGYCFRVDEQLPLQKEKITLYSPFNGKLKGSTILGVYQDSGGDEWVLTDKGVSLFGKKKLQSDYPFKLFKEHNNKIYLVSTSEKLTLYDPQTENIKLIEIPFPLSHINALYSLGENLALATDNGIILYNPTNRSFRSIDIRTSTQPSNTVLSLYEDKYGEIWVYSTTPGITRINLITKEKQHLFTPANEVVKYERANKNLTFEDKQGILWVIPYKGNFSYYDRKEKRLKPYLTDPDNPQSVYAPLIRFCTSDRQGNLWILSTRNIERMSFYPSTYHLQRIENDLETRALLQDSSNRLWVATKSQLIRIYNPDGSFVGYLTPQGKISPTKTIFHGNAYCMKQDSEGTIWIGTKDYGLYRLSKINDTTYKVENYMHREDDAYSLSCNNVYDIFFDSQNNIWVACYEGGLNLLQQSAQGTPRFIHYKNELRSLPANSLKVRCIAEPRPGIILMGTTDGLITFSNQFDRPEEIKFYKNTHNAQQKNDLTGSDIMHIFADSRHDIYVLTFTGGINKVTSSNLLSEEIEFKTYTIRNGLASDLVLSMIEDADKHLWVVAENSLSKFDPQKETFDNFDKSSLHNTFSFTEAIPMLNARKQLVLGTDMGYLEVDPQTLTKSSYIAPIVFTDLLIHGQQMLLPIDDMDELSLKPSQRNFVIRFSALDYVKPENIRYSYRLKGLEEQWNESDKNHSASYINLPAGQYQLEVRSTNSDGVWVDNTRTLSIKVLPTFWETPWAWIIYLILFVLFTASVVYVVLYIYRLRHRVDMEQQLSNIKLKFFTDISHELRTPLTLISSPVTEVLENEPLSPVAREHLSVVRQNTERMLRLINQILDFRKIQNRKMKLLMEETELIAFLRKIMENFKLIAEEKQIDLSFHAQPEELSVWIDRDKVEKIVFNLLSNSFKYTLPGKSVKVEVSIEAGNVCIRVSDEGIGIASDKLESLFKRFETLAKHNMLQPSSGIGLSLVKELVELHHGTIDAKSQPNIGSEFKVNLPLQKEVFEKDKYVEFILTDIASYMEEPNPAPVEESTEATPPVSRKEALTLLIVEDNPDLRKMLKSILSTKYNVLEATNGQEGLDSTLAHQPDMILSDVMMPVMDGLEMVRLIKANEEICHTPIILLTAKSSLDDRIEGLEQGIDDYITKPFSSSYLKTRIESLMAQRKLLQQTYLRKLSGEKAPSGDSTSWEPSQPQMMAQDEQFMQKVMKFLEEQIDNPNLTIDDFADNLFLSRSLFYRKLKSIVGLPPVDFIREIRIKRAAQLIDSRAYNFSQIAYMTGFSDPKYFSKCFKKHMGVTPREYKEGLSKTESPAE